MANARFLRYEPLLSDDLKKASSVTTNSIISTLALRKTSDKKNLSEVIEITNEELSEDRCPFSLSVPIIPLVAKNPKIEKQQAQFQQEISKMQREINSQSELQGHLNKLESEKVVQ